jgi:hypothetical protein
MNDYECHVTVEATEDKRIELEMLGLRHGWKTFV